MSTAQRHKQHKKQSIVSQSSRSSTLRPALQFKPSHRARRVIFGMVVCLAFVSLLIGGLMLLLAPDDVPATQRTFTPTQNVTIYRDQPLSYATQLTADANPRRDFLLTFTVSGLQDRPVQGATLTLYAIDSSPAGTQLFQVADNNWSQWSALWNTAPPAIGEPVATFGEISTGGFYSADVSSIVTRDGTYSFRVSTPNVDGVSFDAATGFVAPKLKIKVE